MNNVYEQFETDTNLETKGIILNYGEFQITIARAGGSNKAFQKCADRKARMHKSQMRNKTLGEEVSEQLLMETYAETVVLGWKNVKDKQGNKLDFNFDNCMKLFKDLRELFLDIRDQALDAKLFNKHLVNEEVKK